MSAFVQASEFIARGIAIFPVRFRDKRPAVPSWEVYKTHLPTMTELRHWFPSDMRNYAVVLGWQRLAVLDFDDMQAYYDWQMWTLDNCHLLDRAYSVKTSRGVHLYFSLLEDQHNLKLAGIDFKTSGYVVGPGSVHPSGHIYQAMGPWELPVIERLADIVPADMLKNASMEDIRPVRCMEDRNAKNAGNFDIYDLAENAVAKSPLERAQNNYHIEDFFNDATTGDFHPVPCPFHDDAHASAWISVKLQLFGCHSCNMRPMSPVGFYAALHQVDIQTAIRQMAC